MIVWAGGPTCQVDAGIALRERSLSTVSGHAEAPVVDIFSTLFARWQIDLLGEYSVRKGTTLQ